MPIPLAGWIVALESWSCTRPGEPAQVKTWAGVRTPVGSFEVWSGAGLDGRIVQAAALEDVLTIEMPTLERDKATFTRSDAVQKHLARVIKAAIGGREGWHPIYHSGVVVTQLGVDRFSGPSRFRADAPLDSTSELPQAVGFDPNDIKAIMAQRRAKEAARLQAEADAQIEIERGTRRVRAFRLPASIADPSTMLADVDVVGLTDTGPMIPGWVHSANPKFCVVEAKLDDLRAAQGAITWVYDINHPFAVGVTAADQK